MLNPFGSQRVPGSYVNLQKRMLQRIQSAKVNDQIFEVVKQAYEVALDEEGILLPHPERKRLLSQLLKLVLEDMTRKLDDRSRAA
jgi:hypothetical protein